VDDLLEDENWNIACETSRDWGKSTGRTGQGGTAGPAFTKDTCVRSTGRYSALPYVRRNSRLRCRTDRGAWKPENLQKAGQEHKESNGSLRHIGNRGGALWRIKWEAALNRQKIKLDPLRRPLGAGKGEETGEFYVSLRMPAFPPDKKLGILNGKKFTFTLKRSEP